MNICVSKNTNQEGFLNGLQTNIKFAPFTENSEEGNSQAMDEEYLLEISESPSN